MAQKTELPDIAKLNHFTEGNLYTGSKTKDWEKGTVIRYKVWPDRENEKLIASCWAQDVCYEKAQDKEEREFPLTAEGVDAVRNWLMERYLQPVSYTHLTLPTKA